MSDWREHFARRVEVKRARGCITGNSMSVMPWTKESWADETASQLILAMRQAVWDEMWERCQGDAEKFRQMTDQFDDVRAMNTGEYGHYLEDALASILKAHPFPEGKAV